MRPSTSWYPATQASIRTIQSLRPAPTFRCLHTPTVAFPQSQSPRAQHRGYATTTSPEKWTPQTLTEKVVQRYAVGLPPGKLFRSGDYISIEPATILTHDNSFPVMTKFMSIGATKVHRPSQLVMALDHDVSNKSEVSLKKYAHIQDFAKAQGLHSTLPVTELVTRLWSRRVMLGRELWPLPRTATAPIMAASAALEPPLCAPTLAVFGPQIGHGVTSRRLRV